MEAAEDTSLEPAIGWLAQSLLGTLLIDKLDAWIRRAGLDDDVGKLKSEVGRVEVVVGAVRGRAAGNNPLSRSLAHLKDLLYDADDLVYELDYCRLQQQIDGVTSDDPGSTHGDETWSGGAGDITDRSAANLRSKHWENFKITLKDNGKPVEAKCMRCGAERIKCRSINGTSVLSNHLKSKSCIRKRREQPNSSTSSTDDAAETVASIVIGDSSNKRKRTGANEESTQITPPNIHTSWDKVELSNKIEKITSQLQYTRLEVSEVLKLQGSDSASSSSHHRSTISDQYLRTSSLVPRKVYGRFSEKNSIIELITQDKSDAVTVVPIVGIAGVGKTALAQLVYNDPALENQFEKIWVWVSHNFDEVGLTRQILDFLSQERHDRISSFAKLQEILKGYIEFQSKRFLIILDDVWDNLDHYRWTRVLDPFRSSHVKGNVILVTTRSLSVAQRIGTVKPVKLGALANDDFWLLFKSHAFGDENYEENQNLSIIGREIAEELKGNPLAAESTGELLREKLMTDYWSKILKDKDWKSLQLSRGIMPALKLSYDQLPYHLQQCFSYCSIFPDIYQFLGEELVGFWISQGFVKCKHSSQRLEEIGWCYLADLVNLGFFQQVKREEPYLGSQILYAMCSLMHDFARIVSTECATIDGLQCNKTSQTIRHLSIVTDSAYGKDQHGNILRNEKFEENLRNTVTSASKLRTLVLLGHYDSLFLQLFQHIFQKAHNLRLLLMSAISVDFLKHGSDEVDGVFPQVLSKLYHLQVLDVGPYTDSTLPDGINNLVSLHNLIVHKGVYSSIATIGDMTSPQEARDFKFQISSGFEIARLQSTNELVQHWVHQLDSVKTLEGAYVAVLRKNKLLEKLHLSWKESSGDMGVELLPMDESGPSSEPSVTTAREMLEGFEPCQDLKYLQISGNYGASSLTGPVSNISVTSLQTLHLYGCEEWQSLPSLEKFPFLTTLKLSNLREVIEVLLPPLEELVLVEMPKLERCSCTSVGALNSSLRALHIQKCQALQAFDLFEKGDQFGIEQRSWLPGLRKLILRDCPHLEVLNPLPPSTTFSELHISGVSTLLKEKVSALPGISGSSNETLHIGPFGEYENYDQYSDDPFDEWILGGEILAFHNLSSLKLMRIEGCRNLMSLSFEGFSHLISLKSLDIVACKKLFSFHVMPEHIREYIPAANLKAFPCLESLTITSCGIMGKWLSLMLQHSPDLEELVLVQCPYIRLLSIGEEKNNISNPILTGSTGGDILHIPFNLVSSIKKMTIDDFPDLTFLAGEEGFSRLTSLEKLIIWRCPELLLSSVRGDGSEDQANGRWLLPESLGELDISDYSQKTLQPCFSSNLTSLQKLRVWGCPGLESIKLHSSTTLEELMIQSCGSLITLEGLQSLVSLRRLYVFKCPGLPPYLMSFSGQGYGLETLEIDDPSILATSFYKHLTSLRCLKLQYMGSEAMRLTSDQERGLMLLKSLQELRFRHCYSLLYLPAGLHTLFSLNKLKIRHCPRITRLPETGLPPLLEELEIRGCSKELNDQCMPLATSKLSVKVFP